MEWLNIIVNSPALHALAKTLLHFSWQGLLIAFLLGALLKAIHDRQSQLRYCVSLLALVLCVVVPVVSFCIFYYSGSTVQSVNVTQMFTGLASGIAQASHVLQESGLQHIALVTTELLETIGVKQLQIILPFIAIAWLAGVVLLSARVSLQVVGVSKLPYQATRVPEPYLQQMFERLLLQLKLSTVTRLLISDKVDVPMAIGWLKPVVLLPSSMVLGLTPAQLEMLLLHELAHVRRHDYLVNFLQTLVELLLFFHPGVKYISKQIRMERECCCDDIAVAHVGSPVAYASTLTDAEMSRYQPIPQLAMAASGSDLKRRILRVVGHSDCSSGYSYVGKASVVAAITSFVMIVAAVSHNLNKEDAESLLLTHQIAETELHSQRAENTVSAPTISEDAELVEKSPPKVPMSQSVQAHELNASAQPDAPEPTLSAERTANVDEDNSNPFVPSEAPVSQVAAAKEMVVVNQKNATSDKVEIAKSDKSRVPEKVSSEVKQSPEASELLTIASQKVHQQTQQLKPREPKKQIAKPKTEPPVQIVRPVLLEGDAPVYPRQALRRGISDEVQVSFVVNTEGRVEDLDFIGSVHRSFKKSIRKELTQWQFQPAKQNGEVIAMTMQHVFRFAEPKKAVLATTGTRIDAK